MIEIVLLKKKIIILKRERERRWPTSLGADFYLMRFAVTSDNSSQRTEDYRRNLVCNPSTLMLCVKYIKIYLIFSFVFYKSEGMRREVKDDY